MSTSTRATRDASGIHISVVVPVYRGAECLNQLYERLVESLLKVTPHFEIVLVDDADPDGSWPGISALARQDPRVRGFQLSRNFGQHAAITCGVRAARGDWVVVMDCDLQDPPEEIPRLYEKAQEGHDVVLARRTQRKDRASRLLGSWLFYRIFNYLTDLNYDGTVANFSIVSRRVVDELKQLTEQVRFYGGHLAWMGFPTAHIDVEHASRFRGESAYTTAKLFQMAIPIILAYSNKPLRICVTLGLALAALSIAGGSLVLLRALVYGSAVIGWPSLIVSIYFGTGSIIATLGIIGLYVDRTFTEVKRRPIYIVRRTTFDDVPSLLAP